MNNLFEWLKPKSRREVLTFIGGGIAAVAMAAWAVLTHESKTEVPTPVVQTNPSINVSPTISPTIQQNPTINILPSLEHEPTMKVTYHLCVAPEGSEAVCDHGDVVVKTKTGESEQGAISNWVKTECAKYKDKNVDSSIPLAIGVTIVEVTCSN